MTHMNHTIEQDIRAVLDRMPVLVRGMGTRDSTCSIAAINLALSNTLDDKIPECMSHVIGMWIINIQDAMPCDIRNSTEWRRLLPLAAGTGRNHEMERLIYIMTWMWDCVSRVQDTAETYDVGYEWAKMIGEQTIDVADRAYCVIRGQARFSNDMSFLSSIAANIVDCLNAITRQEFNVATYEAAHAVITCTRINGYSSWDYVQPIHMLQQLIAITDLRATDMSS